MSIVDSACRVQKERDAGHDRAKDGEEELRDAPSELTESSGLLGS